MNEDIEKDEKRRESKTIFEAPDEKIRKDQKIKNLDLKSLLKPKGKQPSLTTNEGAQNYRSGEKVNTSYMPFCFDSYVFKNCMI